MKTTTPIWHDHVLYEVTFAGTMVYLIQRFSDGNSAGRVVGFANLPDEVKNKIIKHIRKAASQKAFVSTKLTILVLTSAVIGTILWFLLLQTLLSK